MRRSHQLAQRDCHHKVKNVRVTYVYCFLFGCMLMLKSSYINGTMVFMNNSVSQGLGTTYEDWISELPLCPSSKLFRLYLIALVLIFVAIMNTSSANVNQHDITVVLSNNVSSFYVVASWLYSGIT